MRFVPISLAVAAAVLLSACASTPPDQDPVQIKLNDLDARVARLERGMANQVAAAQHTEEMDEQIRELRGRIEELEHEEEARSKHAVPAASAASSDGSTAPAAAAGAAAGAAAASGGAGTVEPSSTEQAVYSQAYDALKAGSYSIAITGFKDFLTTYPTSPLAENAQYWLGEAYYVNHDYDAATGAFRTVLKKWPGGKKSPDALLKLGFTQFAQKQYPAAKASLTEVTQKYPGTDAAKLAADRLHRIPQ
jgi:tol-pal system protein YbgF